MPGFRHTELAQKLRKEIIEECAKVAEPISIEAAEAIRKLKDYRSHDALSI